MVGDGTPSGTATAATEGPSRRMLRRIEHKAAMKAKRQGDRLIKHSALQTTAEEVSATLRTLFGELGQSELYRNLRKETDSQVTAYMQDQPSAASWANCSRTRVGAGSCGSTTAPAASAGNEGVSAADVIGTFIQRLDKYQHKYCAQELSLSYQVDTPHSSTLS